ncbi:hypothetical protein CFI00_21190 [Nocardioides sp. S5]|uniref:septum formation family protein n=1 Tax=Nocardioides sp. S5 TaxID=2017486 RepID=UPI001A8E63C5|nr:septum formation family protein [Nocardioides sp. S5]QSR32969.1 hypothetical protein CFI00_21190 [Nocardioides sp. S5]
MTRRLGWGAALAGLTATIALAGGQSATAADPLFQAPVVGQCFDMDSAELASAAYTEAPVDCAGTHTSTTIAVAVLPEGLAYESRALARFALETCVPVQRKVLGTSIRGLRLTAYTLGYFGPTPEQQAAGARWLRCDLVLGSADDLQPLPAKLDVGSYPFKKSVSRCLAGRDFDVTVCSAKHTYRATAAITVKADRFPSEKAWKRIGTQRCRTAVTSRTYRFGWPSKVAWKAGDHTLLCYSKTRR